MRCLKRCAVGHNTQTQTGQESNHMNRKNERLNPSCRFRSGTRPIRHLSGHTPVSPHPVSAQLPLPVPVARTPSQLPPRLPVHRTKASRSSSLLPVIRLLLPGCRLAPATPASPSRARCTGGGRCPPRLGPGAARGAPPHIMFRPYSVRRGALLTHAIRVLVIRFRAAPKSLVQSAA
ncbi:hypothetical protein BDV93DRAFT_207029 [Ceratobasidium sp. AG-I]|nr:hypothetical protein BDV93DRAFT_207029 [Ceratobasidium sp. AG-I]